MKKVLFSLLLGVLLISACDRYDHEPYENAELEASFIEFSESLANANADSLSGVMEWYDPDYRNNNQNKLFIEYEYRQMFSDYGDSLSMNGELKGYWKTYRIVWVLTGSYQDSILFAIEREDFIVEEEGIYRFYGNQIVTQELNENLPVVLVQFFTGTQCGNCPAAAEKLEDMHNNYGEQLVVIEYVNDSDPGGNYLHEAGYYAAYEQPTALFQGNYKIVGAGEDKLNEYEKRYAQALNRTLDFRFTSLDISINDNTVTSTVVWEELTELSGENIQLRAVLLEEEPDLYYNVAPSVTFENRVLAAVEQAYNNSEKSAELILDCSIDLPENVSLVVWLQNMPNSWEDNGAQIYNTIKRELGE